MTAGVDPDRWPSGHRRRSLSLVDPRPQLADKASRPLGPDPVEQPPYERRADHGAVGDLAHVARLARCPDADADDDRQVRRRLAPLGEDEGARGKEVSLACDAEQPDGVEEAARPFGDGDKPLVRG